MLTRLAANAGLQQLVAPIVLPQGLAGAGNGLIGRQRLIWMGARNLILNIVDGLDHRCGHRFHGEGTGDANFGTVGERLVVQCDL